MMYMHPDEKKHTFESCADAAIASANGGPKIPATAFVKMTKPKAAVELSIPVILMIIWLSRLYTEQLYNPKRMT